MRRACGASLVAAVVVGVAVSIYNRRAGSKVQMVCHPNLSHLVTDDGRHLLLVGTLSVDLDGTSGDLVSRALGSMRPDVVMVEGTWASGLNAMFFSGTWEIYGAVQPKSFNWTDTGNMEPMELPRPKPKGWFHFGGGPPPRFPERSMVPVKVRSWAHHLRGFVGSDIAAAVTAAAVSGVPVRFLGPDDGGLQGLFLVWKLAQQATMELLEEEQKQGEQMPNADVDAALLRAELHIREDARTWLRDARAESLRTNQRWSEFLANHVPARAREAYAEQLEARIAGTASRIAASMEAYQRGAAILAIEQLVNVEDRLLQAGYHYLSQCA